MAVQKTKSSCKEFILLGESRTGSTTLFNIVNKHPDASCIYEPFNPKKQGYDNILFPDVREVQVLKSALDVIYSAGGFKHIFGGLKPILEPPGLGHAEITALFRTLVTYREPKIVFLKRRDRLKRYLSLHIARATSVWHVQGKRKPLEQSLPPVDLEAAQEEMERDDRRLQFVEEVMQSVGVLPHSITYEDLFEVELAISLRLVDEMLSFLGLDPSPSSKFREYILSQVNPGSRVTVEELYRQIPNYEEVLSRVKGHSLDEERTHGATAD